MRNKRNRRILRKQKMKQGICEDKRNRRAVRYKGGKLQINDDERIKGIRSELFSPKAINGALGADMSHHTTAVALLADMGPRTNRDRSCLRSLNREARNVRRFILLSAFLVRNGVSVAGVGGVWSGVHSGHGDLSIESSDSIKELMLGAMVFDSVCCDVWEVSMESS